MEKARYSTELYSNLRVPFNNVKPSNFWGSHQTKQAICCNYLVNSYLTVLFPDDDPTAGEVDAEQKGMDGEFQPESH